jgi:hypothetical protein
MPNWKTYKDQGPAPWNFTRSQAEAKYNQGDAIRNAGQPVWDINATKVGVGGTPITDIHYPNCGMWNGLENPGYPPPPPIVPVKGTSASVFLTMISWTPNAGGVYGRFVGILSFPYASPTQVWYSDDGGVNWTKVLGTAISTTSPVWKFKHVKEKDLFVAFGTNWPVNTWMATSQDGINWTMGTPFISTDGVLSWEWCEWANIWIALSVEGGNNSKAFTSPDALVWTYQATAGLYNQYNGSAILNNLAYFFGNNYSKYIKTDASLPLILTDLVGAERPPYVGYEAANNDDIIVYGRSYYNGSVWADNGVVSTYIDYNPLSHVPSNSGLFASFSSGGGSAGISVSRDGISWTYIDVSPRIVGFDIAVGFERVVTLSNTNYCNVITIS